MRHQGFLMGIAIAVICGGSAHAACPETSLTNGTTADADAVMLWLNCKASLEGPHFIGNVGIGTASPNYPLDVLGQTNLSFGTSYGITFGANGTGSGRHPSLMADYDAGLNADYTAVGGPASEYNYAVPSYIKFLVGTYSSWYEAARISHEGNFGIGTTAPAQKLDVNGAIRLSVLASATSNYLCYSGVGPFVLASCSSSIRYKENIQKARFGLAQVLRMRPVTFKWKERKEEDFGFIAEEMAKIDRHFVTYKNGKIEGVKYPQLTAVLVGAIKELKAENGQLAAKLMALQTASGEQSHELRLLKARLDAQSTPAGAMTSYLPNANARKIKTVQN